MGIVGVGRGLVVCFLWGVGWSLVDVNLLIRLGGCIVGVGGDGSGGVGGCGGG